MLNPLLKTNALDWPAHPVHTVYSRAEWSTLTRYGVFIKTNDD